MQAANTLKDPHQVAELLNVTRDTVYQLCASGQLGCHIVSGRKRFSQEQIDAYLERTRVNVAGKNRGSR